MEEGRKPLAGALWLGTAGAVLVIGGIVALLAANWAWVPLAAQVAVALAPLAAGLGGFAWLRRRGPLGRAEGEIVGTVWMGGVVCSIALLGRVLQLSSSEFLFCMAVAGLLLPVVWAVRSHVAWVACAGFWIAAALFRGESWRIETAEAQGILILLAGVVVLGARMVPMWWREGAYAACGRTLAALGWMVASWALPFLLTEWLGHGSALAGVFWLVPFMVGLAMGAWMERRWAWRPLCFFMGVVLAGLACGTVASGGDGPTINAWGALAVTALAAVAMRFAWRDEGLLLLLAPAVAWGCVAESGMVALAVTLAVGAALTAQGIRRGRRGAANEGVLLILAAVCAGFGAYGENLTVLGLLLVVGGIGVIALNVALRRLSPARAEAAEPPPAPLWGEWTPGPRAVAVGWALLAVGVAAQVAAPGWMLLKRHLILTRGEKVTVVVRAIDPRDLLMGHYVSLRPAQELPPILKDTKRNWLRYYCDQRYAQALDRGRLGDILGAELDVRVWRGSVLAEALRIDGKPAEEALRERLAASGAAAPKARVVASGTLNVAWLRVPWLPNMMGWELRKALEAQGATVAALTVDEAALWRRVRERLGLPNPDAPLQTPQEAERPWKLWPRLAHWWDGENRTLALPLFVGAPFPCERPFAEQAQAYYAVLSEALEDEKARNRPMWLYGPAEGKAPPEAIFAAAQTAFPKARWLATDGRLPEGVPLADVAVVAAARPKNPAVAWVAEGVAGDGLPAGAKGRTSLYTGFELPTPAPGAAKWLMETLRRTPGSAQDKEWVNAFAETLAAEALARGRVETADALLLCTKTRTLRHSFERSETYADYCAFVRELEAMEAAGAVIPLGGWRTTRGKASPPMPPPPTVAPSADDLLRLGAAALAP